MDTYNTKPIGGQPALPTRELWRALRLIFNHYLLEELLVHRPGPKDQRPPKQVLEAIQFLDCCLDTAYGEGWLEEPTPVD